MLRSRTRDWSGWIVLATAVWCVSWLVGGRSTEFAIVREAVAKLDEEAVGARRALPTWLRNAATVDGLDWRPAVAIVIDDLGVDRERTAALNGLPAPLTLAFLPHATALAQQAERARAAGHELLLHVPMEPIGQEWPGPRALLTSFGRHELVSRLRAHLLRLPGFVGINNHMGSRLTADRDRMKWVMGELHARQLLFVDSLTSPRSVATDEARRQGVPYARRDVFLDNEPSADRILDRLAEVERVAKRKGHAMAIGHPHRATIEALRHWLPRLQERGLILVPVSAIVVRRACAEAKPQWPLTRCAHHLSTRLQ